MSALVRSKRSIFLNSIVGHRPTLGYNVLFSTCPTGWPALPSLQGFCYSHKRTLGEFRRRRNVETCRIVFLWLRSWDRHHHQLPHNVKVVVKWVPVGLRLAWLRVRSYFNVHDDCAVVSIPQINGWSSAVKLNDVSWVFNELHSGK